MNTTAVTSAAATAQTEREPVMLRRRIGSTTYEVSVHLSNTSKMTMQDKLLRLMESEVKKGV